ncbi:MAG: hypothetical protein AAF694_28870 [Bacteroidota bacterium]
MKYVWIVFLVALACTSEPPSSEEAPPPVVTSTLSTATPPEAIEDSAFTAPLALLPDVGLGRSKPKPGDIVGFGLLTWDILRLVTFEKKFYETEGQYFDYPVYEQEVKDLEGKPVYISGYLLPINPDSNIYVLSENTFSSCFFCGQAGPESIVELTLAEKLDKSYTTDQWIAFKGTLRLNADDLDHLYYILEDAIELELE